MGQDFIFYNVGSARVLAIATKGGNPFTPVAFKNTCGKNISMYLLNFVASYINKNI